MKKKRIYIAGPISKIEDFNRKSFAEAEAKLKIFGHNPINPCERALRRFGENAEYLTYIKHGLELLKKSDAILLLDGWMRSPGAQIEAIYARREGIQLLEFDDFGKIVEIESFISISSKPI